MEISDLRRRLRAALEEAKRRAAERRARVDEASAAYERFLEQAAIPAFHAFASALNGEGHVFRVNTPSRSVRLTAERYADDYIEVSLDSDGEMPQVIAHINRGRGRRLVSVDRPLKSGKPIGGFSEEDVIEMLVEEIVPFVER